MKDDSDSFDLGCQSSTPLVFCFCNAKTFVIYQPGCWILFNNNSQLTPKLFQCGTIYDQSNCSQLPSHGANL